MAFTLTGFMNFLLNTTALAAWRRRFVVACVLGVYLAGSIGLPQSESVGLAAGVGCQCGSEVQQAGSCCCSNKFASQKAASCCQKKSSVGSCCSKKSDQSKQNRPSSKHPVLTNCDCGHHPVPGVIFVTDPRIIGDIGFLDGIPLVSPVQTLPLVVDLRDAEDLLTPPPECVTC